MDFNHSSNPINEKAGKKVANYLSTNGPTLNSLQKAVAEIQNAPIDAIPNPTPQNFTATPEQPFDPEFIFECADNDDDGSGKLIAQLLQDQFKYDHTAGRWLKYEAGIWLDDKDETAKKTARELCKELFIQAYKFYANESIAAALQNSEDKSKIERFEKKKKICFQAAKRISKEAKLESALTSAAREDSLKTITEKFDLNLYEINLHNGIYCLKTFGSL